MHPTQFTSQRVYTALDRLLPDFEPSEQHNDRYSVDDADGITTQVSTSTSLYPNDPDVRRYAAIPLEAWDPARSDLAATYDIRWIRERDVHPNATGTDIVAGVVAIGITLFARVTSSAVKCQIPQFDGDDENACTLLMLALIRRYPSVVRYRWAEDPSRAGRNAANLSAIVDAVAKRGRLLRFGDRDADPSDPRDATLLALFGSMGQTDDRARRLRLGGKRLTKSWAGGMPKSEHQLPHGIVHKRHPDSDRKERAPGKGYVATCDAAFVPVLQELVRLHAEKTSYVAIGRHLAKLEADGKIERRGQKASRSYQQLVLEGDHTALYDAVKSFFVVNGHSPLIDPDLYLAKVRLWATGTYRQRQANDLPGRATRIDGRSPTFTGDDDTHGFFDWDTDIGFPKVDGQPLPGWGVEPEVWAQVEARLLRERREPRPTGGAAHHVEQRRVLARFGTWTVEDDHYPDEPTQMAVYPRRNNSGKNNAILLRRPLSASTTATGRPRGWTAQAASPGKHVVATFRLRELTASVAHALHRAVLDELLDPDVVAPAVLAGRHDRDHLTDRRARLVAKLAQAQADEQIKRTAAGGLPQAIGMAAVSGETDLVAQLTEAITTLNEEADALAARATEIEAEIATLDERLEAPTEETDETAQLTVLAYLVAGLRRAIHHDGRGPVRLGTVADEVLTNWRLLPRGDRIDWTATARLPLVGGGHAQLPLQGCVSNVRNLTGGKLTAPEVIARYVLHDGRSLHELADTLGHSRKALVVNRLMPWLVEQGLTNRAAKCALVDHPVHAAQQLLWAHLTGTDTTVTAWSPGWRRHTISTYTDPDLAYGFAACPDDLQIAHQIAVTLAAQDDPAVGVAVAELALVTGAIEADVRQLVSPTKRTSGWVRPAPFEYVPRDHATVRLRACPHAGCGGWASHVVVLPETVAGHGIICPDCRRMPTQELAHVQLPSGYLVLITGTGATGSLRNADQTRVLPTPPPALDVTPAATVTAAQIARTLGQPLRRVEYLLQDVLQVQARTVRGCRRHPRAALDDLRTHLTL